MAEMTASVGLLGHFAELEAPRSRRAQHVLQELLLSVIGAILSGADNWVAVAVWGRAKLDWLRQFCRLKTASLPMTPLVECLRC